MDHSAAERTLYGLLSDRPESVVELAIATRKSVHAAAAKTGHECSELVYATYCVSDTFSFTGRLGQAFIHIATYSAHVNLGFNRGVDLPDPDRLLQGKGKSIRHVKLKATADLQQPAIRKLVRIAVAQGLALAKSKGEIAIATFEIK